MSKSRIVEVSTEKRIKSWPAAGFCRIQNLSPGSLVDIKLAVDKAFPKARGIHLILSRQTPKSDPEKVQQDAVYLPQRTCRFECAFYNRCEPKPSAILVEEGLWYPAVRPSRQRN